MRIAFLAQVLPLPLDAGPKIRAHYVLRHLAEAGHEVTLVSFVRPGDRESDIRAIGRFCAAVETVPLARSRLTDVRNGLRSLVSDTPFLILRDQVAEMDARLRQVTARRSFDALHADQLWMADYAVRCQNVSCKVLDQHNAVFKVPARLATNQRNPMLRALLTREASKLESFERSTFDAFDRVVWVSEQDRDAFSPSARTARARHDVIPIAVDPDERRPMARPRPFRVTFLGGTHWPPNAEGVRWFVNHVWPKVAAAVPDCVFTVIGKGSRERLDANGWGGRIAIMGYIPDPEPLLAETAVFVVPLQAGAGMRVKILDAWCWGLPVVSTSIGAEGIRAHHDGNLLFGDSPDAFADGVVRVLRDHAVAQRLAEHGRASVETFYDWRKAYAAWDSVYQ